MPTLLQFAVKAERLLIGAVAWALEQIGIYLEMKKKKKKKKNKIKYTNSTQ